MWPFASEGKKAGNLVQEAMGQAKTLDKAIKSAKGRGMDADAIRQMGEHHAALVANSTALGEAVTQGASSEALSLAREELRAAMTDAKTSIDMGHSYLKNVKDFSRANNRFLRVSGKLATASAVLAALGLGFTWLSGRRDEAERNSTHDLLDANQAALDSRLALEAGVAQPQLGGNTLMGMMPIEGEHVKNLGRGGARSVNYANPPLDIGEPVQSMGIG